jgi:hypothetical protein
MEYVRATNARAVKRPALGLTSRPSGGANMVALVYFSFDQAKYWEFLLLSQTQLRG